MLRASHKSSCHQSSFIDLQICALISSNPAIPDALALFLALPLLEGTMKAGSQAPISDKGFLLLESNAAYDAEPQSVSLIAVICGRFT